MVVPFVDPVYAEGSVLPSDMPTADLPLTSVFQSDSSVSGGMPGPLIRQLPDTTKSFQRKYSELLPLIRGQFPDPVVDSMVRFDAKRAARGIHPVSKPRTLQLLAAASTGEAVTEPVERSMSPLALVPNAIQDLRQILSSVPRLPGALLEEVKSLPNAPQVISRALSEGNLGGVFDAPGVRMLPGAFVASALLPGGEPAGAVMQHPLITALDVAPYGLKGLRTFKQTPRGQRAVSQVKNVTGPLKQKAKSTRPGAAISAAFGKDARSLARLESLWGDRIGKALYGEGELAKQAPELLVGARQFATKYEPLISADRRVELTRLMQSDPNRVPGLSDVERGFVQEAREITDQLSNIAVESGELVRVTINGGSELYDKTTASRLLKRQKRVDDMVPLNNAHNAARFGNISVDDVRAGLVDAFVNPNHLVKTRTKLSRGWLMAAEKHLNLDVTDMAAAVRNRKNLSWDELAETARDIDFVVRPEFQRRVFNDTQVGKFVNRDTWNARDTRLKAAQKIRDRAAARTVPARWQPLVERQFRGKVDEWVEANPSDLSKGRVAELVATRQYDQLVDAKTLKRLENEARETWQQMSAEGMNPVFVHKVSDLQLRQMDYPRPFVGVRDPSQVKKRAWDWQPANEDVTLALTHQEFEWLAKRGSEEFVSQVVDRWALSEKDLRARFRGVAESRALTRGSSFAEELNTLIKARGYVEYVPDAFMPFSSRKLSGGLRSGGKERYFLPRDIALNMKKYASPPDPSALSKLVDPVMKTFRTAVLPLSPRWHVSNLIGGALMLLTRTSPEVFRHMREAWQVVKAGETGRLPEGIVLGKGAGTMSRELAELRFRSGNTMRRLLTEMGEGSVEGLNPAVRKMAAEAAAPVGTVSELASKGVSKAGRVIDWSVKMNGMVDDMWRVMAYLHGTDKAIRKGMSQSVAEQAGITLSRKIMANWDEMTPLERSVMKGVFPFYGWMSHIFKFVMRYPIDHPWRASIATAFAKAELEDLESGFPERFLNMFFLGGEDDQGNRLGLNFGTWNPFADVSDMFTLAGLMGRTNPIFGTVMESLGLDPMSGEPELYPDLRYDAETGRLKVRTKNPLVSFVQNTVPQSAILLAGIDSRNEYAELLRSNPKAASRMLRSQLGLPINLDYINVHEEMFKSELARQDSASKVLGDALKSGDYGEAASVPSLQPIVSQLSQIPEDELVSVLPPEEAPRLVNILGRAVSMMPSKQ